MTLRNRLVRLEAKIALRRSCEGAGLFDVGEVSDATRNELVEAMHRQDSRPIDVTCLSDTVLMEIAAAWRAEK
jgi:hypothetical protein